MNEEQQEAIEWAIELMERVSATGTNNFTRLWLSQCATELKQVFELEVIDNDN